MSRSSPPDRVAGFRGRRRAADADAQGGRVRRRAGAKPASRSFSTCPERAAHARSCRPAEWQGKSGLGDRTATSSWKPIGPSARCWRPRQSRASPATRWSFSPATTAAHPPPASPSWSSKATFPANIAAATRPTSGTAATAFPSSPAGRARSRPASHSDQLVCLTDLMATCADILGVKLPDNAGEDSVSILPACWATGKPLREAVVHHSINGRFAIRQGMEAGTVPRLGRLGRTQRRRRMPSRVCRRSSSTTWPATLAQEISGPKPGDA